MKSNYNIGNIDLFRLPFKLSSDLFQDDLRLSYGYYTSGMIETVWFDGLGRRSSGPTVSLMENFETNIRSVIDNENYEKAFDLLKTRIDHHLTLGTWSYISYDGNFNLLIVRNNLMKEGVFCLENISFATDPKASNSFCAAFDEAEDLFNLLSNSYISQRIPGDIIDDLMKCVGDLSGCTHPDEPKLGSKSMKMLQKGTSFYQVNVFEKSQSAYLYNWDVELVKQSILPKVSVEKLEMKQVEKRLEYYVKSKGFS